MPPSVDDLFSGVCDFIAGGVAMDNLPAPNYPEIAFAGRSNVGKSSLINALVGKKIAHASSMPGRTREINFFLLGKRLMLVDLPGYGYAKASRKDVKQWMRLVRDYLAGRPNLKRVCLLIDSRHGVKDTDEEIMETLDDAAVSYLITLTKTDKIKPAELEEIEAQTQAVMKKHVAALPYLIATSAGKNEGLRRLRGELATITG